MSLRDVQERAALRRRKSFYRVAQRDARDPRTIRAEIALELRGIRLAGFAKHPADGLLNQVLRVWMERPCDEVREIEREAPAHRSNQADRRRATDPHVPMTGPAAHLGRER